MLASNEEGMAIIREIESDRRTAERYLLHYHQLLKEYEKEKRVALGGEPVVDNGQPPVIEPVEEENLGGGRSSLPGKPTEAKAVRSATYDERHEAYAWLKAVEIVQRSLGERKNIFIEIRRSAETNAMGAKTQGRPGWVAFCQMRYQAAMEERFLDGARYVGERTIREWWNQIIGKVSDVHMRIK